MAFVAAAPLNVAGARVRGPSLSLPPRTLLARRTARSGPADAGAAERVHFTIQGSAAESERLRPSAGAASRVALGLAAGFVAAALASAPVAVEAKAIYDHVDILEFDFSNNKENLVGGVFDKCDASGANFSHTDMSNATVSYASFIDANFEGTNLTNILGDRSKWEGANLKNAVFANALMTGVDFAEVASIEGADFTGAMLDQYQYQVLCDLPSAKGVNPTTGEETRASLGCE
eukprot:tig00021038_g17555.t1